MNNTLRLTMIILSIITTIFIITQSRKFKLNIKYAVIWILGSIGILILSIFPNILNYTSSLLSIASPTNALFLIALGVVYLLLFYIFTKISYLENRINSLTYDNDLLRKKLEDNEK